MTKMEIFELRKNEPGPDLPPLDRWRLDGLLTNTAAKPEKLWGLTEIAEALGVSVDTARDLAQRDGVPITRPVGAGRYFAFRSDLMAWLRGS